MFRSNKRQLQPALISNVNELPEKQQRRLEESWAGTFRREFFRRLKEEAFAVLYSDVPSRPNVPVNVLVSLDTLKAGYGWSDEELYDHFLYDLQVRYAVGYESLAEGDFELRTLYNFRRRLSQYNLAHGTNLLAAAFVDITDQQITALAVRTGQQRMDSTQLASNIVIMSRLQLTVEAIQRLQRLLCETDQVRYAQLLAPYVGETAGHYVYRVKGFAAPEAQLQPVGQVLYELLQALAADYSQEPAYQVAARLFGDQYRVVADAVQAKANQEIRASSLQSLDDLEATYREKNRVGYKGYVANVTETCDPQNPLQLITDVRVAPNTAEDSALLIAALPELKQRTNLDTLHTDATYGSPEADNALCAAQVTLIQTAIRGRKPNTEKLHLADFAITQNTQGLPLDITCPQGQTVLVTPSGKAQRFAAEFASATCQTCPLYTSGRCPPQPDNRRRNLRLTFNQAEVEKSQRHRRSRAAHQPGSNLRAAVESTVRSLKHPFPASKLPVRGLFRMTCLIVASAAMTNVRRIQRYRQRPRPAAPERPENRRSVQYSRGATPTAHFSDVWMAVLPRVFPPLTTYTLRFSC
jgi:Transposase DDE domain